ncbi:MAG: hypothetical protein ACE37J_18145 [Pikeienuella sp.]|uniref:hypothetical protein n=1 Tax=Pikeienuella sp. TaxID=2831957 RepID=UPI003919B28C
MAERRRRSRAAVAFLLVWLALLTGMAALVVRGWASAAPEGESPPYVWLAIAAGGWVFGLLLLRRALRGEPEGAPNRPPPRPEGGPGESDRGFD